MYKIDKVDSRILFELDRNARQPVSVLARTIGVSRDVIAYRIRQLEVNRVIQGYYTVIDFSALGLHIVRLYLRLQNTTPEIEERIAQWFLSTPQVFTVYHVEGHFQLVVGFLVSDFMKYRMLFDAFSAGFRSFVAESNFAVFLEYHHYQRNYLVDKDKKNQLRQYLKVGGAVCSPLDTSDLKLLNLLKENARMPLLSIGSSLGLSAAGAQYKLRELEKKKVIVGYKVLLDIGKIGRQYYKVDLVLNDLSIMGALQEFIFRHPSVTFRDLTVGGSDFEFDCEFGSSEEFYAFIDGLRTQFAGEIRSYHYYTARRIYKYSYFPEFLLRKEKGKK